MAEETSKTSKVHIFTAPNLCIDCIQRGSKDKSKGKSLFPKPVAFVFQSPSVPINPLCFFDGAKRRGVNRLTDQRILTVFSPGFRIQSKILTDLRILQLQRFAVFIDFWARSLDFACEGRIVDLSDRQKCLVLFVFVCVCVSCCSSFFFFLYGQDSPNVTQ